ncbi:MAG: 23S rRNA (guanosine(2251)-2'-O)-methyltransferase RlmB [Deltaproteobacteria bacterium]|nr:23S rRNA (guanosine(2251)-2'-O)-methyltransferase RlmB [Deltaproteobacteria bacterium]
MSRRPPATEWIYGRRTVAEHLKAAPSTCLRLLVAQGGRPPPELLSAASALGLRPTETPKGDLDRLARGGNHQGVCLEVGGWGYADLEELAARALRPGGFPLVLVLDSVQDPHNVGAILRVADGAGAAGVIVPKDRAAGLSASVARAAAGALAAVPVAQVVNLARTLDELRERGFWTLGAAGGAPVSLFEADACFPCALVLGGEHKGLRPLVSSRCDALASLPMAGTVSSLNVSVAAGIFSFELLRRWRAGGTPR